MKLYYSPGACSLSPHIVAREAGIPIELIKVNLAAGKTEDGGDYRQVNPKGYVPLLALDNGEHLSEGPAIVQYIADQAAAKNLAPTNGSMARYRLQEWLNFITSELHKGFSIVFNKAMPEEAKAVARAKLGERLGWINQQLEGKTFLMGDQFTVADAYLFTVTGWGKLVGVDVARFSTLAAYLGRIAARPAVQQALKAEGLVN